MCWTTHHIHLISLRATFFLSCKSKNILKGYSFQSLEEIQKNSTAALKKASRKKSSVQASCNGNIVWWRAFSVGGKADKLSDAVA